LSVADAETNCPLRMLVRRWRLLLAGGLESLFAS
jgi:hypothetical protein